MFCQDSDFLHDRLSMPPGRLEVSEEVNGVIETLKSINTEEGFYHAMASILTTLSKQIYGV